MRLWDGTTNTCKFVLKGHTQGVTSLKQISSDMFVSVALDETIKFWNIETGEEICTLICHDEGVLNVNISQDGKFLASASRDKMIKIWNIETGER